MKIELSTHLEAIAASVPGAINVFESAGIDYACGSRLSVREAARLAGIDPQTLRLALQSIATGTKDIEWSERTLSDITHAITDEHHATIRNELPRIAIALGALSGTRASAELTLLRAEIAQLASEIIPHTHDEERNVFRTITALEAAWQSNEKPPELDHMLHTRIAELTVAHGAIAQRIHRIRDLRTQITSLSTAPDVVAVLNQLERLEAHLRQQMFIENCILFPRAVQLEEQMAATA